MSDDNFEAERKTDSTLWFYRTVYDHEDRHKLDCAHYRGAYWSRKGSEYKDKIIVAKENHIGLLYERLEAQDAKILELEKLINQGE